MPKDFLLKNLTCSYLCYFTATICGCFALKFELNLYVCYLMILQPDVLFCITYDFSVQVGCVCLSSIISYFLLFLAFLFFKLLSAFYLKKLLLHLMVILFTNLNHIS